MAKDRRTSSPHREVLEQKLGRSLQPTEVADHEDEDKENNVPSNLRPMQRGAHTSMHNSNRGLGKLKKSLRMFAKGERLY